MLQWMQSYTVWETAEERMYDVDTAPDIRGIGTDGVPADHQHGGLVYPVTGRMDCRKTAWKAGSWKNREDRGARKEGVHPGLLSSSSSSVFPDSEGFGPYGFPFAGKYIGKKDIVLIGKSISGGYERQNSIQCEF